MGRMSKEQLIVEQVKRMNERVERKTVGLVECLLGDIRTQMDYIKHAKETLRKLRKKLAELEIPDEITISELTGTSTPDDEG